MAPAKVAGREGGCRGPVLMGRWPLFRTPRDGTTRDGTTDLDHVDKGRVVGLGLGGSSSLGGNHVDEREGSVRK
jgi:hypothetical protein